jgi:hypothetical protein
VSVTVVVEGNDGRHDVRSYRWLALFEEVAREAVGAGGLVLRQEANRPPYLLVGKGYPRKPGQASAGPSPAKKSPENEAEGRS